MAMPPQIWLIQEYSKEWLNGIIIYNLVFWLMIWLLLISADLLFLDMHAPCYLTYSYLLVFLVLYLVLAYVLIAQTSPSSLMGYNYSLAHYLGISHGCIDLVPSSLKLLPMELSLLICIGIFLTLMANDHHEYCKGYYWPSIFSSHHTRLWLTYLLCSPC